MFSPLESEPGVFVIVLAIKSLKLQYIYRHLLDSYFILECTPKIQKTIICNYIILNPTVAEVNLTDPG